ncbi:ribosome recycling factor [Patescibacteria group bacterium]|nr:ribosome recycling factor [Patescibacteria group bacterium]
MDSISQLIDEGAKEFAKAHAHLLEEFAKLQIGRASAGLIEGIMIDSYGTKQPLKSVASISIPDAKTINIQPWDKSQLHAIEKAISEADIGIFPNNNGTTVILNVPPLTEERRKDLAKMVGKLSEEAKITIRNSRQNVHSKLKGMKDNKEITEDDLFRGEKLLQEKVDEINEKIDEAAKHKEHDIMTV